MITQIKKIDGSDKYEIALFDVKTTLQFAGIGEFETEEEAKAFENTYHISDPRLTKFSS